MKATNNSIQTVLNKASDIISRTPALADFSKLDAEILLTHVIHKQKEYLFAYPEHKLTKQQVTKYFKLINLRSKSHPISY